MDGIGEIIYIIIMVAIFIFSALRKKKPQQDDMPVPEDRESGNPFDEVLSPFKEIFGDDDTASQEQKPQTEPATANRQEKNLKDAPFVKEDYVFTSRTSPQDARRQRKNQAPGRQENLKSKESQISREEEEEAQQNINNWFNLRDAVIYSEILKRPDY